MLSYLVYTSTAVEPFSDDALLELLRRSREANGQRGVTGALLYRNGIFVQMLEGSEQAVEAVRERIYRDPRHTGVLTLLRGQAEARVFEEWTMHFLLSDERTPQETECAYRLLRGDGDLEQMATTSGCGTAVAEKEGMHPGLRLLLTFRQIL